MVLMTPVLVASAAANLLSLLNLVLAPMLEVNNEEACLDSFDAWFYPPLALADSASIHSTLKRISVLAASKRASGARGSATSRRESRRSFTTEADTLNATTANTQLQLVLETSDSLQRLSTLSPLVVTQASTDPLALPGCTELAGNEHLSRGSQGSPRPSSSVPGIQGAPEFEAVAAGLCTPELASTPASRVPQESRVARAAACGVPQQFPAEQLPALRHVVPGPKPSGEGQEEGEELLLGSSSSVRALIGVWEARGKRIQESVSADCKLKALRPYRSLPSRLQ